MADVIESIGVLIVVPFLWFLNLLGKSYNLIVKAIFIIYLLIVKFF